MGKTRQKYIKISTDIPTFTPNNYEIRRSCYGQTGGNCMVGTVEFYLPEIDITVWSTCNGEVSGIYTADTISDLDNSGSWEEPSDYSIADFWFKDTSKEDTGRWLPIIEETLKYTMEEEIKMLGGFTLPVDWLPDSVREKADPKYLNWLQEQGKWAEIGTGGLIEVDEEYCGN